MRVEDTRTLVFHNRILKVQTKMLKSLSGGGVQSLACPINGVFTEDADEFEDNISSSIFQTNIVFVIICKKWFNCRSIHLQGNMHGRLLLIYLFSICFIFKMIS